MGLDELTTSFNNKFGVKKTREQVRSTLRNHKFTCGRKAGSILKGVSILFTSEQIEFLKSEYPGRTRKEITNLFNIHFGVNRSLSQITAFIKNNKIKNGLSGRFVKGQKSWNSGTKGLTHANSGSFKKGNSPANKRELGSERICPKDGYILVKVEQENPYTGHKTRYRHKQIVVWELANGAIPKGMNLRFKDGDKLNVDIDNLELVSKALNLRLNKNQMNAAPDEVKPTIRAISELEIKTFQRLKE